VLASIGYAVAYTGVGIALLVLGFYVLDLLTPGHLGRHIYEHRSLNAALTLAAGFLGQGDCARVPARVEVIRGRHLRAVENERKRVLPGWTGTSEMLPP